MGFFSKIKESLTKTKASIAEKAKEVMQVFTKIDDALFDELEDVLITADVGYETSAKIIEQLRQRAKEQKINDGESLQTALKTVIIELMQDDNSSSGTNAEYYDNSEYPKRVILIIGVNGVGKTTSIGKLAAYHKAQGKRVMLAAGDTFRAAAIEQLDVWAERAGCEIIKQKEGSDPAAVIFDALSAAKARNADILICDTAGRLHTKKNLMNELEKINKLIAKEIPGAKRESLLVLDASTGQNALSQAKAFGGSADVDGIILTKLDGTAKGGIVIAIKSEQNIPVKYIGIGEKIDDFAEFDPTEFVNAIFD